MANNIYVYRSAQTRASDLVRQYIMQMKVREGERLPSEKELAKKLEISRNTLREGIRALEALGMVEVKNGKGIYVRNSALNTINMRIESAKINFTELLQIRKILEKGVLELVEQNAGEEDYAAVQKCYGELEEVYQNPQASVALLEKVDMSFHHHIYQAAHNALLYEMIRPMAKAFTDIWNAMEMDPEGPIHASAFWRTKDFHRELAEGILLRDFAKAKTAAMEILDMDVALFHEKD